MTYKRYTGYPTFTLDQTKGSVASALTNGRYHEVRFSDDGTAARMMSDRTVFTPTVRSYGGTFPFCNNQLHEYGTLFCRYQTDFDSCTSRTKKFEPITVEGGVVTLSKIAPLHDLASLYLAAVDDDGGAQAGLLYSGNEVVNDWVGLNDKPVSLEVYVKPHGVAVDGASLTFSFEDGGFNKFGLRLIRDTGAWELHILVNGSTLQVAAADVTLDQWAHIIFERVGTTYSIYLNGSSIHSDSGPVLAVADYSHFQVLADGISETGTSFFVSNLRLDLNAAKKSYGSYLHNDDHLFAIQADYYFPFDTSEVDPFYDRVTCLIRSDYGVKTVGVTASSEPTSVLFHDVVGYNRATWQPNGFATSFAITQHVTSSQWAPDPNVQRTSNLAGVITNQSAGVTGKGYPHTIFSGTYMPWLRISERDRRSLTFDGDFTFEVWCYIAKPNPYLFSTAGGIALVNGELVGLGADIDLSGFGVTTHLNQWNHVAIVRSGSTISVYVNAALLGTGSSSATANFNDLDFFGANGVTTANQFHMKGVIGQVRATTAARYYNGADVTAQVFEQYQRLEYPLAVSAVYDAGTDFVYGIVPWQTFGLDGANPEVVRLTLFKFNPRERVVTAERDLWSKSNEFKYPCDYTYHAALTMSQAGGALRVINDWLVMPRLNHEYVMFSKADLTTVGTYSSYVNDTQHVPYMFPAGANRFVTWLDSTTYLPVSGGSTPTTAVADAYPGYLVMGLHFSDRPYAHIFKDTMNNVVLWQGDVHDDAATNPRFANFGSTRNGLVTVKSSPDFALAGDFTIELEARFVETAAGNITACTLYSQNNITISASGLTLTATVFGNTLQFVGTGSGLTATFGAATTSNAKIHHIALTRTSGVIRLFLNGVMAQKVTDATASTASDIVLGNNFRGMLDEVFLYNGVSKYNSDASFTPSRYTNVAVPSLGMPITHRATAGGNYSTAMQADGVYTSTLHTLATADYARTTPAGNLTFNRTLVSPALPLVTNSVIAEAGLVYHEANNELWIFQYQEPLNGTGNIGYIWDLDTNAVTPIPKQGNMLHTVSTSGSFAYKFNTVTASNTLPDFGTVVNNGLTIDQDEAWGPFYGSLVMNKVEGEYARMPLLPNTSVFATAATGFTTGNWTIELRYFNPILQAETSADVLLADQYSHTPRFEIGVNRTATDCKTFFRIYNGVQVVSLTSLGAPEEDVGFGSWAHIALVRDGANIYGLTNGVRTHVYTLSSSSIDMVGNFILGFIGCSSQQDRFARGRIQEISISNGIARYTGTTYTVPTAQFINRASSAESVYPNRAYYLNGNILYCARIGTFGSSNYGGAWMFNSTGTLTATYGFVGFEDSAHSMQSGITSGGAESLWLGPKIGTGDYALYGYGVTQQPYVYVWELDQPSEEPTRRLRYLTEAWPSAATDGVPILPWTSSATSGLNSNNIIRCIPKNPAATTPPVTDNTPPASYVTLPVPEKSGEITGDMVMDFAPTTRLNGLPMVDEPVIGTNVKWHKITHDGTRALKISLMQPSDYNQSAMQRHNVDRYLGIALYGPNGMIVQRPYTHEHMLSYVGVATSAVEASIVKPYVVPLVIPRGFPAGDYWIATMSRLPSGIREISGASGNVANAGASSGLVGFNDSMSAARDAGIFMSLTKLPQLSIACEALPLVDTVGGAALAVQGDVEGTLSIETASPLAGAGSLEFDLAAIGPSQEVVTLDPLWYNTLLLTKMENSYTDLVSGKTLSSTSGTWTTSKQFIRFGGYSASSGGATWTYTTTDLVQPDRNALTVDMYVQRQTGNADYATLSVTFSKNTNTQSLLLSLFRDATTNGLFKLRVRGIDTEVFGGTMFDTSSSGFELPAIGKAFHLAFQKDAPVANVSTVKLCVNGVVMASVNLSVATGYVTGANRIVYANTSFYVDELRVTTVSRYPTTPFVAPHYTFPIAGTPTPAPTAAPTPAPTAAPTPAPTTAAPTPSPTPAPSPTTAAPTPSPTPAPSWALLETTTASDAAANDGLGGSGVTAVSLSADGTIGVVGAEGDDSNKGAAYIFTRTVDDWAQTQKLVPTGTASGYATGRGVAISGDKTTIAVTSAGAGSGVGMVTIYTFSGTWSQAQQLNGLSGMDDVTLSNDGNTLVTTAVDGYFDIFFRSGGTFTEQAAGMSAMNLGSGPVTAALSSNGNWLAIGSASSHTLGIYNRSGSTWSQYTNFTIFGSGMGSSVSISNDGATIAIASGSSGTRIYQNTAGTFALAFTTGEINYKLASLSGDANTLLLAGNQASGVSTIQYLRSGGVWSPSTTSFTSGDSSSGGAWLAKDVNYYAVGNPGDDTAASNAGAVRFFKK